MTSDCLNKATCDAFETSRPRKKARRSCLNCQRAHKTCGKPKTPNYPCCPEKRTSRMIYSKDEVGNERPCEQCVKRGISSKCVDGNRKLPKYLYEVPNNAVKADFYCTKENILNIPNYGNAVTERDANLEEQIQDRRRETSEEVFDEIIDPTFLYTESSYENRAFVGTIVEDNGNSDHFFRNTQYSPWADVSSTESEHSETEKPVQTPENIPGDSLAEPQEFDMLGFQALNMDSYDEYVVKELECDESSYGFAISSGWSSTFFPSEIEEEPQGSMDMAAISAECKH